MHVYTGFVGPPVSPDEFNQLNLFLSGIRQYKKCTFSRYGLDLTASKKCRLWSARYNPANCAISYAASCFKRLSNFFVAMDQMRLFWGFRSSTK